MIQIKNLSISYSNKQIINSSHLTIKKGNVTLIVGQSGCGKTTLLQAISLNIPSDYDSFTIDGNNINSIDALDLRKQYFSFVFQDYNLLSSCTVKEQLELANSFTNKKDLSELLIQVGLNNEYLNKKVNSLSGGERQRLAIALAIAKDTPYIIMDEPTASLDEDHILKIVEIIDQLKEKGKGIIIATHMPEVFHADSIYRIESQKLIAEQYHENEEKDYPNTINDYFLFSWIKIHKIKYVMMSLILGIGFASILNLMLRGNTLIDYVEKEIEKYNSKDIAIYNSEYEYLAFTYGEVINEENLDSIEEIEYYYPAYEFGDTFCYDLETEKNANFDQNSIQLFYNGEVVNDHVYQYTSTQGSSPKMIAIDEEKIDTIAHDIQGDIEKGIYIPQDLADTLMISDVEGYSLRLDISVPCFSIKLDNQNLDENTIVDTRAPISVKVTLELPIKGILNTNVYNETLQTVSIYTFCMDYHDMAEIQKETIQSSINLEDIVKKDRGDYEIDEDMYTPRAYMIRLKSIDDLDTVMKQLRKVSYNYKYAGTINDLYLNDTQLKSQKKINTIIALVIMAVVLVLSLVYHKVAFKKQRRDYAYLHVNGIKVNDLYITVTFIQFALGLILSFIFATVLKYYYNTMYEFEYISFNFQILVYFTIFVIVLYIANVMIVRKDIQSLSYQEINKRT